jgi:hypothetical protein
MGFDYGFQAGQKLRETGEVNLADSFLDALREDIFVIVKCFVESVFLWIETFPPDFRCEARRSDIYSVLRKECKRGLLPYI